jgi:hypothetical protein
MNISNDQEAQDAIQAGSTGNTGLAQSGSNQNKEIPLVFMKESELFGTRRPERSEWIQHVEMFKAIGQRIEVSHISGLQRVRGMWRIYIDNLDDKVKLMSDGIPLRGKIIPVLNTNPDRLDGEQTTRIRIKNIPLSADDGVIKRVLTLKGTEVISLIREKLRVDNKLTNCETGDRLVIVKSSSLKEPLPTFMTFGTFTGRVFHPGQPKYSTNKPLKCSKCLEDGHTFSNCTNDWVCTVCKMSGHKRSSCPGEEGFSSDVTDSSESETSEEETEPEQLVPPEQQPANSQVENSSSAANSDQGDRRKVQANRGRKQQSLDRFVTPLKTINTSKAERSPPTPAEELHDKLSKTKKKKSRKHKSK